MSDEIRAQIAVPKWVYVLTISALLGTNGIFAGWYSNALDKLGNSLEAEIVELKGDFTHDFGRMQVQINKRFENINEDVNSSLRSFESKYKQDVIRFYDAAERNGEKLDKISECQTDLAVKIGEIRTIQQLVIKKVELGRGTHHDYKEK